MAGDAFVTLVQLHDPVQAELLIDVLEQAGIPVTSTGLNHRAMLGMIGSYVQVTLQVPADRLQEARELLASLQAPDGGEHDEDRDDEDGESDEGDEDRGDEDRDDDDRHARDEARGSDAARAPGPRRVPRSAPRLKRVAAFAALAFPFGGGHFYARSYPRALALVFAQMLTFLIVVSEIEVRAVYLLVLAIVADLLGSFEAADRANTGVSPSGVGATLGRTLPWILPFLAIAPVALRLGAPDVYIGPSGRDVCAVAARCAGEDEARCTESLAEGVSRGASWSELSECALCAEGASCEELYEHHECGPDEGSIVLSSPFGTARCEPETLLRSRCAEACRGLLPEQQSSARAWSDLAERWHELGY